MTRRMCRRMGLLPVLLAVLSLALPLAPVEAGEKAGDGGGEREVSFAGMTISIDPETGRMRPPSAEEVQKLRAGMRALFAKMRAERALRAEPLAAGDAAALPETSLVKTREDGVLSAIVGAEHLNFSVATVGPDGEISTGCVNGVHDEADHTPPAPAEE